QTLHESTSSALTMVETRPEQAAAAQSAAAQALANGQSTEQRTTVRRWATPEVIDEGPLMQVETQSAQAQAEPVETQQVATDAADTADATDTAVTQPEQSETTHTQEVSTGGEEQIPASAVAHAAPAAGLPEPSTPRTPLLDEQQQHALEAAGLQWVQTRSDYSYEAFHVTYFQHTEA